MDTASITAKAVADNTAFIIPAATGTVPSARIIKLSRSSPPVQVVPLLCNKFKLDVSFPKPLFIFLVLF
jgi:hypothetical protein